MTQPPYPPQQPYPPPGPWPAGPPRKPFWRTVPGALVIAGGVVAVVCVLACVGAILLPDSTPKPTSPAFEVAVIGCTFSPAGDSLQTVTVGLMVRNVGSSARSATVSVEYRDAEGTRVDTDTARFDSIQPGDTVRKDEVTILDAAVIGQGTCVVTRVR